MIASLILFTSYTPPISDNDMEIVRQRVIDELMKSHANDSRVENLTKTIQEDGSWANINYIDVSRTGFEHGDHLRNMLTMSRAYKSEKSAFYQDETLKTKIISALEFWTKNDFICDNWWWNQIGTPGNLVSIVLIMDEDLPENLVKEILPIIGRAHINAWGARQSGDRIKIAGISAKHYLFLRDEAKFDELIRIIDGEIKFVSGRGLQYDYSFHHRVDRVNNTLSYGMGYANAFVEWARYVNGTEYTLSEEKIHHLIDYYLEGICKHMVYGKFPDPGVKNRSISRRGALGPVRSTVPEKLLSITDYRKEELEEIAGIRNGEAEPTKSHSIFYWHSEHYTHQRPGYFTSVRMYSSRNHNMEVPYNGEGLLNHHRGDGTNHLSVSGEEYKEIWPVFDYQKIPGTTILQKPELPPEGDLQKPGLTDFVGAVTDGNYGAAAFDFISPHDLLRAKKAWFFFDEEYVCLGTGITCSTNLPVATTLNQCLLKGNVTVLSGNNKLVLEKGEHELNEVEWVFHNGVAYLFPENSSIKLSNSTAYGSWYNISRQSDTPKDKISKDVFKLWLDHGTRVGNGSYQYIVVPATGENDIDKYKEKQSIKILENSPDVQAVKHTSLNICQVAFYKSGTVQVAENLILTCNSQGMVMIKSDGNSIKEITVSDPSRKLDKMHLTANIPLEKVGENFKASWNESGKITEISIDLPQGHYAGKSVTIQF